MSRRISIGLFYALLGAVLTPILHWSLRSISPVGPREWFESPYLPIWVACVMFLAVAFWARFTIWESAIQGLLITGPPYFWLTALYARTENSVGGGEYAGAIGLFLSLAVSGTVLNPLISMAVEMVKRRPKTAG